MKRTAHMPMMMSGDFPPAFRVSMWNSPDVSPPPKKFLTDEEKEVTADPADAVPEAACPAVRPARAA